MVGINLTGDEGEVTVLQLRSEDDPVVEETTEEEVAEEVEEETTEEEVVEEETVLEEEATTVEDQAEKRYSNEDLVEAMRLTQEKMIEQFKEIQAQEAAAKQPATTMPAANPVATTLEELYSGIEDDSMLTGKDIKELLTKTFTTLNSKAEEHNVASEATVFAQGSQHYIQNYIPKMITNFGLKDGTRDAQSVKDSYLRHLVVAQQEFGQTTAAIEKASNNHMMEMRNWFKAPAKVEEKTVVVPKKLASKAIGGEPAKSMASPEISAMAKRIENGTATTMDLIRALNTKK